MSTKNTQVSNQKKMCICTIKKQKQTKQNKTRGVK